MGQRGKYSGMKIKLADRRCVPCKGGVPPLKGKDLQPYLDELGNGWEVVQEHHLEKTYKFKNFQGALEFTNKVGQIAEGESHHPEITLSWGLVSLRIWTHKISGLSESDFILAAKAEQAFTLTTANNRYSEKGE